MEQVGKADHYPPKAKDLYRRFSFELESRVSPTAPSDQLARIIVEDRIDEDRREHDLAEARKHFKSQSGLL